MASCGGSLINDRYILTAAHCMKGTKDVKSLRITLGAHTASDRQTKVPLEVEKIISHPDWKGYNDIALIKLKKPVANVPVCLPSFTSYDNLFVTGWGMTGRTGNNLLSRAQELMEVDVKEVDVMKCKQQHFPQVNPEKEICAGGDNGGSCMGDSGGPLQTRKNGRVYQVGIVSFGATDCSTLSKAPNVYERVTGQLDWIRENTKDANYCDAPEQAISGTKSPNQVSIPGSGPGSIPGSGFLPAKTPSSEGNSPTVISIPGSGFQPIPVGSGTMRPIFVTPGSGFEPTRPSFELGRPTFITGSGFNPVPPKTISGQWTIAMRPIGGSLSDPLKSLEDIMEQSGFKPLFPTRTSSPMTRVVLNFPTLSSSSIGSTVTSLSSSSIGSTVNDVFPGLRNFL